MSQDSVRALVIAVLLAVSTGLPAASTESDGLLGDLQACARIADKLARYACYDALGERALAIDVATTAPAPEPGKSAQVETAPGDTAQAEPPAMPADLGKKKPEKKEKKQQESYRGHVRSCAADMDGIWRFTFDDGQVWQQSSRGRHRFEGCNFDVTITRDFFGYKMSIDGDKTLRVRRLH